MDVSSWCAPPSRGMEKQSECGGGTPSRGDGGAPASEGSDSPKVPPGRELGGVLLLMLGEEPPPGLLSSDPLAGCGGGGPSSGLGGGGGGGGPDSSLPCSSSRRMLQVARDSDEEDERLSESLVVSFFCLVLRFWNHTFTCRERTHAELLPTQEHAGTCRNMQEHVGTCRST